MADSVLIRKAALYDAFTWLLALGRPRRVRARMLAPARVQPGETLLDVGCGTGTLTLLAKEQAGAALVAGIDASQPMIMRARRKAQRQGLDVQFDLASADALPFPDGFFDVVVCTATLHHLPRWMRVAALNEMHRVLKPGGRVLLVDFVLGGRHSIMGWLHHHHGLKADELRKLVTGAGLPLVEQGPLGIRDMQYVIAVADQQNADRD